MNVSFNYLSSRARKARFAGRLTSTIRFILLLTSALLACGGAALWTINGVLGAALLSPAVLLLLPILWYRGDLSKLKPEHNPEQDIIAEKALAPDLVGRLRSIDNPKALWAGLRTTWQQNFFALRYGISAEVFDKLLSDSNEHMPAFWVDVVELQKRHNNTYISDGVMLVALTKTIPNYETLLAELKIDINDLESSIDWLRHTNEVNQRLGKNSKSGGLARDWTAGFTPTLNRMAHNMTLDIEHGGYMHRDLAVHKPTVDEMLKVMGEVGRQNAVLVGELGAGKTTTVYSFAQKLLMSSDVPGSIRYNQVFSINASNLISQASDGAGLENTLINIVNEAAKAKNTILFLDEAQLFFNEGTGSADVGKVLQPVIQNGTVPIIMAMSPTDWQSIAAKNQSLAGLMNQIVINEPNEHDTLRILEDQSLLTEARHKVVVTYQALQECYRLAERYSHDSVFPGRAIRLLESAVNHADNGLVTPTSVQQTIEQTLGVKVQTATKEEKQELLNLEEQIHTRMVNQTRAVKVVSDALRRARSGVTSPNRPIGTFMFLGPTGVGKTELSKAIAATYFRSEDQLIRVDMNEMTQSEDIHKLIDAGTEQGLIAQIRRQPFSVVLFDEIEKAHPDVINVFLQLLDEGQMLDSANKKVSFRDAIVISTSNAGAQIILQQIEAGLDVEQFEKPFLDALLKSNIFKPEFLNRFDELVVFRPLKKPELMQVIDLMLAGVNKNLERQKVAIALDDAAKEWLVDNGNDPRLGARPLRRMVQRTVENIVAKELLKENFVPGTTLTLSAELLAYEHSQGQA